MARGRFLTPDPVGYRDSSNLYAFAGGDPVNNSDPTGRGILENLDTSRRALSNLTEAMYGVAANMAFGDEHAEVIRVNARKYPGRQPVVYVNGILNDRDRAIDVAAQISDELGVPVDLIWNPSGGFIEDALQTILLDKPGAVDASTIEIAKYLRARLKQQPAERVTLFAHSQGVAKTSTGSRLLSAGERGRLDVVTSGGASYTLPNDFGSLRNIVNLIDPVPLLFGKTLTFEKENNYVFFVDAILNHPAGRYMEAQQFYDWLETPAGRDWRETLRRETAKKNWDKR